MTRSLSRRPALTVFYLEEKDIVLISEGKRERGKCPSRSVELHREIYAAHPEIKAITCAQCPAATAFSVVGAKLDTRIIPESYIVLRSPPVIPYGMQFTGEKELAKIVGKQNPVVIIANDAILTVGSTLSEAFDRMEGHRIQRQRPPQGFRARNARSRRRIRHRRHRSKFGLK